MLEKYVRGASIDAYKIVTGGESWINAYEPETKQMWVFEDEPNPKKVVRGRNTSKQMVACFFAKTGHAATVPLEHRRTVNSEWYNIICLPKVFGEIRETNKRRRIIVYHDKVSSYTLAQNVELMGHPSYSPDLAPNDFLLCQHIRKKN